MKKSYRTGYPREKFPTPLFFRCIKFHGGSARSYLLKRRETIFAGRFSRAFGNPVSEPTDFGNTVFETYSLRTLQSSEHTVLGNQGLRGSSSKRRGSGVADGDPSLWNHYWYAPLNRINNFAIGPYERCL